MNENSQPKIASLPQGISNAYAFSIFNIMSYSMVMGTPMLLYFKKLNASATVLSVVASLIYILNIFQIPAANFVERVGYKKFVLSGWSLRTVFVILMAVVAILPSWIDNATRMYLMLILLFCYNTSRGISSCGFLPWTTQMVPEAVRGRYISRDQMYISITGVFITGATAVYLHYFGKLWHFSFLFAFGFIVGLVSLFFLKRMPDVPVPYEVSKSRQPVPWGAIIRYKPFQKLLAYNFIVSSAMTVSAVFYVPFLRDFHHASDSFILIFGLISGAVGIVTLFYFGKQIDRVGNQPFLTLGNLMMMIHFLTWCGVAAKIISLGWTIIFFLQISAGLGNSFFNMANTRMAMSVIPPMGRSHFFALFSVCNSLTMGLTPILWGLFIDALGTWNWQIGDLWNLNAYTILFATLALIMVGALMALRNLQSAPSMTTEAFMEELLVHTPRRAISRLWRRRPVDAPEA